MTRDLDDLLDRVARIEDGTSQRLRADRMDRLAPARPGTSGDPVEPTVGFSPFAPATLIAGGAIDFATLASGLIVATGGAVHTGLTGAAGAASSLNRSDHAHPAQIDLSAGAAGPIVLARQKLTADTQYRLSLSLDATDTPTILIGPGGAVAPDWRLRRTGAAAATIDNGAAGNAALNVLGTLQRSGVNVVDATETTAINANARHAVSKNSGATVGTRRRINLIEGTGIALTIADDAGNEEVDVTIASTVLAFPGYGGAGYPVDVDLAAEADGVSALAARADHKHSAPSGAPSGTGTANAAGASASIPRLDHVHLTNVAIKDEGAAQGDAHTIDFVGAGVTATVAAGVATITIGGGGVASQVSNSAVSGAADYVARIKIAADTTFRAFLGLTAADEGSLELGPGGAAARDLRLRRSAAKTITVDDAAAGNVTVNVLGTLQRSGSSVLAVADYVAPTIALGTAAAAGVATTPIRSDATIVAFDVTVPVTQAFSDAAATGAAAVAARRDHRHGMPAAPGAGASLDQFLVQRIA